MESQNPWWKGKEAFEEDEDYKKWRQSSVRWVPQLLEEIKLETPLFISFMAHDKSARQHF